ncbi:MAG TPA: DUF1573 domain-containing protein [Gemmatales bacterium]|mgnify:CR=1 FL=1|nr:DUF1573 domain-containing protein [Gemmatales bacterium]HMP60654.1 DUF1573 domain-containing protein [Gemmatales bacterium]
MRAALVFGLLLSVHLALPAQSPPDATWPQTQHDFGMVPHGAQLVQRFVWRNPTSTRIEISDIRASCNCVTATPQPRVLEPGAEGTLDVAIDCRRFVGAKTVTVQLVVSPGSKPVTLLVHAHSRQDVVYNPGQFQFGVVAEGASAEQVLEVEYAGTQPWKIEEITADQPHVEAHFTETYRRSGQVGYRVTCTLKGTAPAGDLKLHLQMKTNDASNPVLPIAVEATIRPAVAAAPNPVNFGTVRVGQRVQRRFTIRSDQPFSITQVDGDGPVKGLFASSAANVHTVLLEWTPTEPGEWQTPIVVHTTLPRSPEVRVTAQGQAR